MLVPRSEVDEKLLTREVAVYNNPSKKRKVILWEESKIEGWVVVPRFCCADTQRAPALRTEPLELLGELRQTARCPQVSASTACVASIRDCGGACCLLPTGSGKSKVALAIAVHLRVRRTCIIIPPNQVGQWRAEIHSFVKGAKVGMVKECQFVVEGCDFVLLSVPTLVSRGYDPEMLRCDLLIVDEAHECAAQTYRRAIMSLIPHAWSLGMTANKQRADGMGDVVQLLLGPIAYEVGAEKCRDVEVNLIEYTQGARKFVGSAANPQKDRMVRKLMEEPLRNSLLLALVRTLHEKFPGRQGLLFSTEVSHLRELYKQLDPSWCCIITGSEHSDLTPSAYASLRRRNEKPKFEKFLTLTTFQMFGKGLDYEGDFVVLGVPVGKGRANQAVGRITRGHDTEAPLVFDILDGFAMFEDMARSRIFACYRKRGFKILRYNAKAILDL
jgi:superfamily II DNA or RNA helicase